MSNKNLPIVLGLLGVGIITLVGGGWYFRQTAKEWIRESEAYDEADVEEQREKRARLEKQVEEENEYDPNYADEQGLFGSSSGDSDEKISDLWLANDSNNRDSFSDKGGSKKNRKSKKSVSKRRRREKSNKNHKNTKKMSKRNRSKRRHKKT